MAKLDQTRSKTSLGFDPNELSQRYEKEREKRIRPDADP